MNILITGARAPISVDIARILSEAGHRIWMADSLRFPIGCWSLHVQAYHRVPSALGEFEAFASAIAALVARHQIERVIPTSEEVFWLAQIPELSDLLFAPAFAMLDQLHNKARFAALAQSLGCGPDENIVLSSKEEAREFVHAHACEQFVFKPVYSRFGHDALLAPDPRQVLNLDYRKPWLAQQRVQGQEYCVYNVAQAGKVLLHQAYLPCYRAGQGASVYFEPVQHDALQAVSAEVVQHLGLSGQISFDVMLTETGPILLECNPRGTSGVHLAAQNPAAFAAALLGKETEVPECLPQATVLTLPFLMYHAHQMLQAEVREDFRRAQDAMRVAGIPWWAPLLATGEVFALAVRYRVGLLRACTLDIEWNGNEHA